MAYSGHKWPGFDSFLYSAMVGEAYGLASVGVGRLRSPGLDAVPFLTVCQDPPVGVES